MPESQIQRDSSALWSQLVGKVDQSVHDALERLDQYQEDEQISPFLAETVRRMFFDSVADDPKWLNRLMGQGIGSSPKFIASEMEMDGGFRLQKAAEFVAQNSGGVVNVGQILSEYTNWQSSDEDEVQ